MITFSSRQRNANVGQKKGLKLQTKEMFCPFKGFFLKFLYQAGRDNKMLKQQAEEEKQKELSYGMLTVFLKLIVYLFFLEDFEYYQENHHAL